MSKRATSRRVVFVATLANALIAAAKFFAASITNSSALRSEAIHSCVDTVNELLLLLGQQRSRQPPDDAYPFGHGKEMYFWSLVVAVVIFAFGGGMAVYEGVTRLMHATRGETSFAWNYGVLAAAAIFEGASFVVSYRALRNSKWGSLWSRIRRSKDPAIYGVVVEDSAALVGIGLAFVGTLLSQLLESRYPDAIASIAIGVVLAVAAIFLIRESKGLLVGESADLEAVKEISRVVAADAAIEAAGRPLTMQLAPDEVLVNLEVRFRRDLTLEQQARAIDRLERAVRERRPEVKRIFIEAAALSHRWRHPLSG